MQQTALKAPDGPIDQPDSVIDRLADVTPVVVGAFGHAKGERVREITQAFVRHMHAFVREIGLKEEEYEYGVDFLNRIGKATNDHHNEGILFADSIGVSTLTCLLNNGDAGATETSAALLGPFWRAKSPLMKSGGQHRAFADAGARIVREDPAGRFGRQADRRRPRSTSGRVRRSASMKTRIRPRST